jgi:glycosidase
MPWSGGEGAGFTTPEAEPWLPIGDAAACNVEDQRADPDSTLHLVRDLIALRRDRAELRSGAYASLPAADGVRAWRRGDALAIALNLTDTETTVDGLEGTILRGTTRARAGEAVDGALTLDPWEGAIVERNP